MTKLKLLCLAGLLLAVTLVASNPIQAQNQPVKQLSFPIRAGSSIQRGERYVSASGDHSLAIADDGNLIVKKTDGAYVWGINEVVGKDFQFSQLARATFRTDSGIELFNANGGSLGTIYLPRNNPAGGPKVNITLNLTACGSLQVQSGKAVLASTDGNFGTDFPVASNLVIADKLLTKKDSELASQPGWSQCYELNASGVLKGTGIKIFATNTVSYNAIKSAALIYALMIGLLQPDLDPEMKNPQRKFNGFKVFITNTETGQALKALSTVKDMWTDGSGPGSRDYLLGGANGQFVWICEQMICKKGIATRNSLPGVRGVNEDKMYRSFDQVVHEFAHSIDAQFDLQKRGARAVYNGSIGPVEGFAAAVQSWFGVSFQRGALTEKERAFMNSIFKEQVTLSPQGWK